MMHCDSHIHVVGDPAHYPMVATRTYTAPPAPMAALQDQAAALGITRFVIVQPSFYGTDNRLLLETLDQLGGHGRGVAVIDPAAVTDAALVDMDRRGVRGLRINLYSTLSAQSPRSLDGTFHTTAAVAARMGWHVEVLAALPLLAANAALLAGSPAPVVLDHYALYAGHAPGSEAGQRVLDLLRQTHVWLKLSAPYRVGDTLALRPEEAWLRAFLDAAAARCVWGSDWPHTPPHEGQTGGGISLPYRVLDYAAVVAGFRTAIGDTGMADTIMTNNAARLYGFDGGNTGGPDSTECLA